MHTYILRRILLMFPTLLGITLIVFIVMASAPGGISAQKLIEGQELDAEQKQALEKYYNKLYGLNDPAPVQYLRWLNNVSPIGFTFDDENKLNGFSFSKGSNFGTSFLYGRPVLDVVVERVPITLLLNIISLPLIYIIAISFGVRAAVMRGKSFDIVSSITMLGLWSVPTMLAGVLFIGFFASDQYWHWFPTAGLSDLEALDMPFLPHWSSLPDILFMFLFMLGSTFTFIWLSMWNNNKLRVIAMTLVGFALGLLMALNVATDIHFLFSFINVIVITIIFFIIAKSEFIALRVVTFGIVGLFIGLGIAMNTASGEFVRGFALDRLWHLVLPVICLSYGSFAALSKLMRTAVLENLLADFARTARAKGVSEEKVLWRHVFRNSLLPLITISASLLPTLLAGSVIVEAIFSIDGMGKLAVEAVKGRDREMVLSVTLVSGILTLVGYLIADICYAIVDPRVSYD
ncbi:ABC transporter, inner membrane subunit [hydrothermal vent metagenome]|uniref:ABC transporter, inner membrane subunit n=1 Tax=hydrothermal vent metagenome TaxID=652676 RepID=A0A3B1AGU2_9ZZZZ